MSETAYSAITATLDTGRRKITLPTSGQPYGANRDARGHPERVEAMPVRELWRVIFKTAHRGFYKDSEEIRA